MFLCVAGFAMGMVSMPSIIGVGHYFDKRRAIATGIAVCGGGVGTFCVAPLSKVLLQQYDWKGAHLIIGEISYFPYSVREFDKKMHNSISCANFTSKGVNTAWKF